MSEDNLLASVARGDRHAFEELYRVYYRRLIRFLATRIPTSHSADEIIDDTFMVVWRCAGEFRQTIASVDLDIRDYLPCCAQVTATQ